MAERVEIVSGVRRRRDWSDEDKLRFVAETYGPGTSVSAVARRHDLSPGLLFTSRWMAEGREPRAAEPMAMLPVRVAQAPTAPRGRPPRAARMEIGLPVWISPPRGVAEITACLAATIGPRPPFRA